MISIITALYNRLDLSTRFLASLEAHPPSASWEIIWVDDGSTDGTRDWLLTLPAPRHRVILNDRNLGYAASNNRGAQAATGEILALLNNDLVLTPGWFLPMHATLDQHPQAGVIGNVQRNAVTGEIDHSGVYYYARGRPTHDRVLPDGGSRIRPVIAVTAACMLMKRERFHQLGGFDEQFINGSEDVDLCLRSRAAGWQNLVALDSIVHHHVSASPGRSLHNQRNGYLLMRRWQKILPDLAAESWREVPLRDLWEAKLTGFAWLAARLTRRWHRHPGQTCPRWMKRNVTALVARQLARWHRLFPEIKATSSR